MNPLADLLPAKYRKYVYAVLSLAALVITVAQIAGYDMTKPGQIVTAVAGTLGFALAHGNTDREG